MNILNKLFSRKVKYNGVIYQTPEQEAKNWRAEELVASAAMLQAKWRTVNENEWKRYSVRNQDGSGSCVAQTVAKMIEIHYFLKTGKTLKFSASPIYKERINKPQAGMVGVDALNLAVKYSTCKEADMPSEFLNDQQIDALSYPVGYEDINNFVTPNAFVTMPISFEYVAGMVEKEGCAMIWVNTDYVSWCKDIPTAGGKKGEVVHSITAVDAITFNGKKYIVIEDSWGEFGMYKGQRLISEEFFKDAVTFAACFTELVYDIELRKFTKKFEKVMVFGEKSEEVKYLQEYLKAKGFFPANQTCTGYYGHITALAVNAFQVKYQVASPLALRSLTGVNSRVGKNTLAALNNNL